MLVFILRLSASQFLTIDLGSTYVKTYKTKYGQKSEIALNFLSKRYTPTFISYKIDKNFTYERGKNLTDEDLYSYTPQIGENALEALKIRPSTVSGYFPAFIDRDLAVKAIYHSKFNLDNNASGIHNDISFNVFMKYYLNEISHNEKIDGVSVIVPAIFTVPQRQVIKQCIKLCGYNTDEIIDDVDAMIHTYVYEKYSKIANSTKVVVFIDVGGLSTKIYAVLFNTTSVQPQTVRLYYNYIEILGGQHLTNDLTAFIMNKYNLKNVTQEEYHRIFESAEKIKIKLITTQVGTDVIEDFRNEDKEIEITRNEFEEAVNITIENFKKNIEFLKNMKFDEIELFGYTSKIPIVRDTIQKCSKVYRLGNSLSPDDSLASGGALYTTIKGGFSKYRPTEMINIYPLHTIDIIFKVHDEPQVFTVCNIEKVCMEEFKLAGNVGQIDFRYTDENSFNPYLITVQTKYFGYDLSPSIINGSLIFSPSYFHLIDAKDCNYINGTEENCFGVNWTEATYIKEHTKLRNSYSILARSFVNKELMEESQSIIQTLNLEATDQILNNKTLHNFSTEEERNNSLKLLNETAEWAEQNKENTNGTLWYLKANLLSNDILKYALRIRENETYPEMLDTLNRTLSAAYYYVYFEFPKNKTYVNKSKILDLQNMVNNSNAFLENATEYMKTHEPYKDWKITSLQIKEHIENISYKFIEIYHAQPPAQNESKIIKTSKNIINKVSKIFKQKNDDKDL